MVRRLLALALLLGMICCVANGCTQQTPQNTKPPDTKAIPEKTNAPQAVPPMPKK